MPTSESDAHRNVWTFRSCIRGPRCKIFRAWPLLPKHYAKERQIKTKREGTATLCVLQVLFRHANVTRLKDKPLNNAKNITTVVR